MWEGSMLLFIIYSRIKKMNISVEDKVEID